MYVHLFNSKRYLETTDVEGGSNMTGTGCV